MICKVNLALIDEAIMPAYIIPPYSALVIYHWCTALCTHSVSYNHSSSFATSAVNIKPTALCSHSSYTYHSTCRFSISINCFNRRFFVATTKLGSLYSVVEGWIRVVIPFAKWRCKKWREWMHLKWSRRSKMINICCNCQITFASLKSIFVLGTSTHPRANERT